MKRILFLLAVLIGYTPAFAQTTAKVKAYQMYVNNYMKPKRGHEKQFETAVKAHNAKFHAAAPYAARLSQITEGTGSNGWYIWSMGPCMYTDLDHQPNGTKEHDDDWNTSVDPNVDEYGESMIWKLQEDLSFTPANYNPDHIDVWTMDIKPGMRYQFADLMKKWKAMWDANKYPFAMRVFYNDLWNASGKDAGIVYSFNNYAEFDLDISWKKDYEKMYGEGSWDNFWKEWNECVVSTDECLRKFVK